MSNKRIWNYWSSRYDKLLMQKYSLGITRDKVIEMIQKHNRLDIENILDIGCGTGQLLEDLERNFLKEDGRNKNPSMIGIDYSPRMIDVARKKGIKADFSVKDVAELATIDRIFDIIVCTHSLPYYKDQKKAIKDMTNLLKEGGLLILAHGSSNSIYDKIAFTLTKTTTGSAKYLSKKDVIEFCDPNLVIVEMDVLKECFWMPTLLVTVFRKKERAFL